MAIFLGFLASFMFAASVTAADYERPYPITEQRAPCSDYQPLRRPHFGDTHVHTSFSFDANSQDTRNTPGDAYKFAKGGRMGLQPYDENDVPLRHIQLDRPLDFTAITDHAEFLGEVRVCSTPGVDGYYVSAPLSASYRPEPKPAMLVFSHWSTPCPSNRSHNASATGLTI